MSESTVSLKRSQSRPKPALSPFVASSSPVRLYFKQLYALLWKCYLTRKVHFLSTFFECIGPLLLPILIVLTLRYSGDSTADSPKPASRSSGLGSHVHGSPHGDPFNHESSHANRNPNGGFGKTTHHDATIYKMPVLDVTFQAKDFHSRNTITGMTVIYSPKSDMTDLLVASLARANVTLIAMKDESAIRAKLLNLTVPKDDGDKDDRDHSHKLLYAKGFLGVTFFPEKSLCATGQLSYTLLSPADQLFNRNCALKYSPKSGRGPVTEEATKMYETIVKVLSYINRDYLRECCRQHRENMDNCAALESHLHGGLEVCRMPYPAYTDTSSFALSIIEWLGLLTCLGYVLVCPLIVKRITDEKAGKVKEMLRLLGMADIVFWSGHFLNYLLIITFHAIVLVLLLFHSTTLLVHSSPFLGFLFFLVYGIQLTLFSMLVTTVWNRPVLAVIVTVIFWIVATALTISLLHPTFCNCDVAKTNIWRHASSFLPTGSLFWVFAFLGDLEKKKSGLRWSTLASHESIYTDFTALYLLADLLLSLPLYGFLIFYLDNVWPFQFGLPKSPIFFLLPSYWHQAKTATAPNKDQCPRLKSKLFEPQPKGVASRIELHNVCKSFTSKMAVNHLWLDIYENQLTVLLGHNGAGKSTTMNMITGFFGPDLGSIYLNGFNVATETSQARRSVGLCPQENIYFNELTVDEHLKLFALLKDFSYFKVEKEVNYVLDLLALQEKRNCLADDLSGGMKRKLALGIALIGDTQILILDEPTSGMDPEARRIIWDLLLSIRRNRTILLTTHFMEEADILGDRIAILNEGQLCCSGSPLFLKNAFGAGYRLRVAKAASSAFNAAKILRKIRTYVSGVTLVSELETEVIFSLEGPKAETLQAMPALLADIEERKDQYGIESCGLSYTTLEDVFLSVGADKPLDSKTVAEVPNGHPDPSLSMSTSMSTATPPLRLTSQETLLNGRSLCRSRLCGLFLKRFHFARRYWPTYILQLLIPAAIIAFAMYLNVKINEAGRVENNLLLNATEIYGKNIKSFYDGPERYMADYNQTVNGHVTALTTGTGSAEDRINGWLLQKGNDSLLDYINNYLYGLEIGPRTSQQMKRSALPNATLRPWYNNEQYHSLPLSLIATFEALLHSILPTPLKSTSYLNVTLKPVLSTSEHNSMNLSRTVIRWALTCIVFLPIAFPFLGASYVLFPVKERVTKSKLLQLMTGLSPTTYWTVNFLFDLLTHSLAAALLFGLMGAVDNSLFGSANQDTSLVLFLLIFAYGFSTIPFSYALSYFFDTPQGGFVFLTLASLLFGFIANMIFSIVNLLGLTGMFPSLITNFWVNFSLAILRMVPIFSFLYGYQKTFFISSGSIICDDMVMATCPFYSVNKNQGKPLDWDPTNAMAFFKACCPKVCGTFCYGSKYALKMNANGTGIELTYLLVSGLLYLGLIIACETYKLKITRLWYSFGRFWSKSPIKVAKDSDVKEEAQRIQREVSSGQRTDLLTVHKLKKNFGSFTAVDGLSFGVRHGEMFGFLGVNGAGKTTTFSMLTGDLVPSSGDMYLGPYSLMENISHFRRNIGYCPQFDALLEELTGDEILYLFGRLRGVPGDKLKRDVDNLVEMVGLEGHRGKQSGDYSGGNKRKLSIAMALIGSPPIILLDEPTTGVDPAARRKIWQTLGYIKRHLNCSIVLTSHSMEECEALCSRIGIMVAGAFRCLGSTQHLRHKFGKGYSVAIRLRREDGAKEAVVKRVQRQLTQAIPSAVLKDAHQCALHFHITDPTQSWTLIFATMNQLNEQFHFEDYTVSDTTLEQIFIAFARRETTAADK